MSRKEDRDDIFLSFLLNQSFNVHVAKNKENKNVGFSLNVISSETWPTSQQIDK